MKKYILALLTLVATTSINAQVVKVYKNGVLDYTATNTSIDKYKVVFEEVPAAGPNLLPGKFTVNSKGKQVQFTKSNLYWDGRAFKFEENQTDGFNPTSADETWNPNHVSHFYWSKTASVMYAETYSDSEASTDDTFFFAEANKSNDANKIDGTSGYFALSNDEWEYLINGRTNSSNLRKYGVSVTNNGTTYTSCLIIAPDGYTNSTKPLSSTTSYTLDEINTLGLVCLPAAGGRLGSSLFDGGGFGFYWSSTPDDDTGYAYSLHCYLSGANTTDSYRHAAQSLRLVALPQ